MEELDHKHTQEVVCPWCGYEHGDSWEIGFDDGEDECCECGKQFHYVRDINVTYSTYKKDTK